MFPFLRQAEADKAEYDSLKKQYEEDAAARLRGENPEHRSFVPSYAGDQVPQELLPAVIPNDVCPMELLLIRPVYESHAHRKTSPDSATGTVIPKLDDAVHHEKAMAELPTPPADETHLPDLEQFANLENDLIHTGDL
ncbi:hypothetical protein QFC22_000805 [Naganishia vaughanmartiniae]|uniref:Uncharacterized protein n=1 Tax=Naganishia vaughanmartiniae TaxID=1424756 RepID=A0ACC2XJ38_9TREE|nr:hypothetical protein QFC22_000805 [Naganishia vaughanmartiniae]